MITVSYGHAVKLAAIAAAGAPVGSTKPAPLIDPALYRRDDVRPVLAERDIAALYLILKDEGVTQRQIAELTGQSQSEVSEILGGRKVLSYDLLVRIAVGLRIPRGLMGLSYGEPGAYGGEETTAAEPPKVDDDMRRRALIAATSLAALGRVVTGVGELTELALPTEKPLPSRLGMAHVHTVEAVTDRFRSLARQLGGQAELFGAAAQHYTRWLSVPATDVVTARLRAALAELHTETGWAYCRLP